jgi:threonine-phosphate decarboxylase
MLVGHGNDIYHFDNEIIVDFSSNIARTHIREKLLIFLQKKIKDINNYPEPEALPLKKAIAKYHKVSVDNVIVTNGSSEAFYLIAQTFPKKRSLIGIPSFSEYEDACTRFGHEITFVNNGINEGAKAVDLIWLGNPNNPNGIVTPLKEIESLCTQVSEPILVIDEAFGDLSAGFQSALPLVGQKKNVIVVRSLTKAFSVPGLRIGYLVAKREIAEKIRKNLIPWSVNNLAIEAGIFIMNNYGSLLPDIKEINEVANGFSEELNQINGIKTNPSNSNFILAQVNRGTAAELKQYLVKNHGLLIRDASNFRGLTSHHFRVSVRSKQQNQLLINAIKDWMKL